MFAKWDRTAPIVASFGPTAPAEIHGWVDAALIRGDGCGGVFWCPSTGELYGFHHTWTDDEMKFALPDRLERESTGILEAVAVQYWVSAFERQCRGKRVLLRTDSTAVQRAFSKGFSTLPRMREPLRATRLLAGFGHMTLRIRQAPPTPTPLPRLP